MDRQDQTTDGKFEGGIFSGIVMEENGASCEPTDFYQAGFGQTDTNPMETHYFNNASDYIKKPEEPSGRVVMEEKFSEDVKFSEQTEKQEHSSETEMPREAGASREAGVPKGVGTSRESGASREAGVSKEPEFRKKELAYANRKCGEEGFCRCRNCPNRQKSGQTVLVIISLTAVAALVIAFLVVVFGLVTVSLWKSGQPADAGANGTDGEKRTYFETETPKDEPGNKYGEIPLPETGAGGEYYGEIADAVRTDLNYSIEWENYEYEGNNDNVTIAVDYPVIKGDVPNLEVINDIIDDETEYFEEYYEEYSKYMMPGENFLVYSEGYVTFMDQEVMSVVFCEMIYTDYWTDYGLFCLNIDMENGVVLDNNSIMDIDNEFAVDFRKRCRQQNGTVSDLDSMTDQEIVHYLTTGATSILFYTPLGMEVGLNMGEYYVTVTYTDYEKFLQRY